jgi:hypothetical protein
VPAKVIGVAKSCAPDGSHRILVEKDGEKFPVTIPLNRLEQLIEDFQKAAILRSAKMIQNVRVPELTLTGVRFANQGQSCELMVSTSQIGTAILKASDDLLRSMKTEIDRVLSLRGASVARH